MKKYFAIFAAIAILGMLAIYFLPEKKLSTTTTVAAATTQPTTSTSSSAASSTSTSQTTTPTATSSSTTTSTSSASSLKDGTINGSTSSTPYGDVQIAIVVSGGKITDVKYLAYPSDDRRSQMISSMALPTLKSETLSAQSANIDGVSGASYTSQGYVESLQAAIDAAKA
jgi:uncharacterized protein with FMN-binding domain